MTKTECPNCGGYSMVNHDEITCECLECRELFHSPPSPQPKPQPPRVLEHEKDHILLSHFTACDETYTPVAITKRYYDRGGLALQMWCDDGPLLTATSWIPGIPAGCVAIKNYSENEGVLEQLIQAGVIEAPHTYLSGFPICRLLL